MDIIKINNESQNNNNNNNKTKKNINNKSYEKYKKNDKSKQNFMITSKLLKKLYQLIISCDSNICKKILFMYYKIVYI